MRLPTVSAPRALASPRRLAVVGIVALGGLAVVGQLALPRIAERVVRDRLGGASEVTRVEVRALPAIKLLWRHADRVTAHARTYDATDVDIADELAQAAGVGRLDVRIDRVRVDGLALRDVRVQGDDGALVGEATVDPAALADALPFGFRLLPTDGAGGGIAVEGRVGGARLRLRVIARDGRIVAVPDVPLIGLFVAPTVFADPRIAVDAVAAAPRGDGAVVLTAHAHLR